MKSTPSIKSSRIPLLLSAFACPGAGQFMQRRWLAGIIFAAGFLWGFFWLMVLAMGIITDFYKMAFEFETYEPTPVSPIAFIAPVAIATVFYLISLFDVFIAQQRNRPQPNTGFTTTKNPAERVEKTQ